MKIVRSRGTDEYFQECEDESEDESLIMLKGLKYMIGGRFGILCIFLAVYWNRNPYISDSYILCFCELC